MPASRCSPTVRVGCCGFAGAQADYFATFNAVEINSSFYQLPRRETAARWRAAAPPGFIFTMKAWQVITHPATSPTYRRTTLEPADREHAGHFGFNATIRWAWDETFAIAEALDAAVVVFQCPASFRSTPENIRRLTQFFERAKRGRFFFGWEPRGDWPAELVARLCRDLDLVHVVDPFQQLPAYQARIRYYRLHGLTGVRHRFSDEELRRLRGWCRGRQPTYCFFNTLAARQDAKRFLRLL